MVTLWMHDQKVAAMMPLTTDDADNTYEPTLLASNGVLHRIDSVIFEPDAPAGAATTGGGVAVVLALLVVSVAFGGSVAGEV